MVNLTKPETPAEWLEAVFESQWALWGEVYPTVMYGSEVMRFCVPELTRGRIFIDLKDDHLGCSCESGDQPFIDVYDIYADVA